MLLRDGVTQGRARLRASVEQTNWILKGGSINRKWNIYRDGSKIQTDIINLNKIDSSSIGKTAWTLKKAGKTTLPSSSNKQYVLTWNNSITASIEVEHSTETDSCLARKIILLSFIEPRGLLPYSKLPQTPLPPILSKLNLFIIKFNVSFSSMTWSPNNILNSGFLTNYFSISFSSSRSGYVTP
jgi:hypothetical protein